MNENTHRPPRKFEREFKLAALDLWRTSGKTCCPDMDLPAPLLHALCNLDFRYCTHVALQPQQRDHRRLP